MSDRLEYCQAPRGLQMARCRECAACHLAATRAENERLKRDAAGRDDERLRLKRDLALAVVERRKLTTALEACRDLSPDPGDVNEIARRALASTTPPPQPDRCPACGCAILADGICGNCRPASTTPPAAERDRTQRTPDLDSLRKTVAINRGQSAEVLAAGVLAWCAAQPRGEKL